MSRTVKSAAEAGSRMIKANDEIFNIIIEANITPVEAIGMLERLKFRIMEI